MKQFLRHQTIQTCGIIAGIWATSSDLNGCSIVSKSLQIGFINTLIQFEARNITINLGNLLEKDYTWE